MAKGQPWEGLYRKGRWGPGERIVCVSTPQGPDPVPALSVPSVQVPSPRCLLDVVRGASGVLGWEGKAIASYLPPQTAMPLLPRPHPQPLLMLHPKGTALSCLCPYPLPLPLQMSLSLTPLK